VHIFFEEASVHILKVLLLIEIWSHALGCEFGYYNSNYGTYALATQGTLCTGNARDIKITKYVSVICDV
jgi:hypothetical protein